MPSRRQQLQFTVNESLTYIAVKNPCFIYNNRAETKFFWITRRFSSTIEYQLSRDLNEIVANFIYIATVSCARLKRCGVRIKINPSPDLQAC
jgi:hypothetical protein